MNLERVAEAIAPGGPDLPDLELTGLAYDTRSVAPGALFFCVPGFRRDGHDFAAEALGLGAVALVVERPLELDCSVPQIVVADVRAAMAQAAVAFFGDPTRELEVVGVTGTNGKTTTTYLLYEILVAAGRSPGLLGTIELRVGGERRGAVRTTAEAIDLQRTFREMLDAGHRSCALEATSHGSELRRLDGVRFAALVFTNLTQDHLDFHGTLERYFDAKRRLFLDGTSRPPAAVNVGDAHGCRLAAELDREGVKLITFGLVPDADVHADAIEDTPRGTSFTVGELAVTTQLRGDFNVVNALGAIAAARLLGLSDGDITQGLAAVPCVPGRFEPVDEGQPFTVLVDYAHTPDSLENVLRAARGLLKGGKLICVFGCGGDRDRGKRPLMGRAASALADTAIVTSDNPRSEDPHAIIAEIVAGMERTPVVIEDRSAAIAHAVGLASPGDVVVVAGKGHERGQEIGGEILPFDDRGAARAALRRLLAAA